jgi:hypothetical protein
MVLGLPNSDPLVRGTDPDPAPFDSYALCYEVNFKRAFTFGFRFRGKKLPRTNFIVRANITAPTLLYVNLCFQPTYYGAI